MRYSAIALVLLLLGCGGADKSPVPSNAAPGSADVVTGTDAGARGPEPTNAASAAEPPAQSVGACLVQDGERISENAIVAIGTEPFWGARVEGRCVTYSTPEDQDGTRVWTRFSGTVENGRWSGALDGQPFVMATRPQPGCSDGMSDNLYPLAVTLTVRGERRTGCAESLAERERRKPA